MAIMGGQRAMADGADVPGMSVVVYAKDLHRTAAFYQAVLGIPADRSEPGFAVLDGPGWQLVVHAIPARYADEIVITDPPEPREDAAVKPVLPVADLAAARTAADTHGGGIAGPEREWTFRGTVRCDGHDPEGNVLQLSAPPAAEGSSAASASSEPGDRSDPATGQDVTGGR